MNFDYEKMWNELSNSIAKEIEEKEKILKKYEDEKEEIQVRHGIFCTIFKLSELKTDMSLLERNNRI